MTRSEGSFEIWELGKRLRGLLDGVYIRVREIWENGKDPTVSQGRRARRLRLAPSGFGVLCELGIGTEDGSSRRNGDAGRDAAPRRRVVSRSCERRVGWNVGDSNDDVSNFGVSGR